MSFLSTFFLAIGLAMDAFAVSITGGIVSKSVNFFYALRIAVIFATFQMLMPLVGWWLGQSVNKYIEQYDHWVAFILLLAIGGKMIYESFQNKKGCKPINFNKLSILFFLAIATSIDALVAGISLSFLKINFIKVIIYIGIVTFFFSFLGVRIGKLLGCIIEKYAELSGGIILIIIGLQLLISHIFL